MAGTPRTPARDFVPCTPNNPISERSLEFLLNSYKVILISVLLVVRFIITDVNLFQQVSREYVPGAIIII